MGSSLPLFPEQASTVALDVDHLLYYLLTVTVFFTVLIFFCVVYFAIKYRRRSETELPPQEKHGGWTLEITWSVIPLILAMVMFAWGASVYMTLSRPPDDSL